MVSDRVRKYKICMFGAWSSGHQMSVEHLLCNSSIVVTGEKVVKHPDKSPRPLHSTVKICLCQMMLSAVRA